MNIQKTAREIGLFEAAINLAQVSNSPDVLHKIGNTFPIPPENIADQIDPIAQWLLSFHKDKYLFFSPEIALAESIGRMNPTVEVIFALPHEMDPEAKERLMNNLPQNVLVNILEEPYFPKDFLPSNAMCVICGYMGGNRPMILPDTYRMVEHYNAFKGKKAFVPYVELTYANRCDGWMELNAQRMSMKWGSDNEP